MNELAKLNTVETITSREVAELTGKEHNTVMRDIRVLAEQVKELGEYKFAQSFYVNSQNKKQPQYQLTKKESLLLASGYSALLRAKIIDRWEELENRLKTPTTMVEALTLALEQAKKIEQLQAENQVMLPKAQFFDAVADSKDALPMADVAKVLDMGVGRNKLFDILRKQKVLDQNNKPYQSMVDRGYFRVVEQKFMRNGEQCINIKTLVYQKGVEYIRRILCSTL